ncbi:MAG: hypothetical protein V4631_11345 [Pseudomonadota bacterium]
MAETTNTQTVKSVLFDAAANYLYVTAANAWGAPGCPSALYITINATTPGFKQFFAAVLAAQASGKTVRFQGTCNASGSNYFDATYIEIQ